VSLVATRVGLRHRCTIERDANAASLGPWGQPEAPDWQTHLEDVPCRAWTDAAREPIDIDRTAVLVDRRILLAPGVDVTEADRVTAVLDEHGDELMDGPMGIEGVIRRSSNVELLVRRIR